uniref:Uncharacterized protein n=1 Tax=Utricularia reniformis TaxID=192314 RepID=A0A1Y0B089_9LAMI|nr:hypothetical protein AEK19_MT0601 [Utricularia reniformis]ART30856.1 hypothetical protein AEK19_MT0601 [Utricularia reniformis]
MQGCLYAGCRNKLALPNQKPLLSLRLLCGYRYAQASLAAHCCYRIAQAAYAKYIDRRTARPEI